MKKLFGIAALLFALTPFAQAQNLGDPLAGHPDARNDRTPAETAKVPVVHHGKSAKHQVHHRHAEQKK